ncbi:uncharacterized protein LOC111021646 [Momordica charantia]|uniref:Uncharacterized protein LOC111021646 n=1 Tax=Momordica charantia TaxID=3673 RepID=A0A6J1DLV0_MOMCH|nr:uncharacterized protein LOC111021646 [Momordica charantia]
MFVCNKLKLRPNLCRRKFTTGDVLISNFLRSTDGVYVMMQSPNVIASRVASDYDWEGRAWSMLSYIDGTHSDNDTRWMDVDAVYLPYNIGGVHWIVICIDFDEGELIVWDSFMNMTPLPQLEQELKPMITIIPTLICRVGVHLYKPNIPLTPWRIRRVSSAPQQGMDGDCGIFCINFFEYDVTSCSFDTLTQSRMSFFRRQFAVQLWANKSIM